MTDQSYTASFAKTIADISQNDWDALNTQGNPFTSYAFFKALEDSRSLGDRTGWHPFYLVIKNEKAEVKGLCPSFIKTNSWGEYIFDHAWAEAYERSGLSYYPKIQIASPFTPVEGPRFLGPQNLWGCALEKLEQAAEDIKASTVNITFLTRNEFDRPKDWLQRLSFQFHWFNQNYTGFEDFLFYLKSKKRKAIRRERREIKENGICHDWITGKDLTPDLMQRFYDFYIDTIDKKWAAPYLTPDFFQKLIEVMPDKVVLILARRGPDILAGALNFLGQGALFGRYWGCLKDETYLHFETCYYQAIDYAIKNRLARVEAGAQGPHKVARGYLPTQTYSLHYIRNPYFRDAIGDFLKREQEAIKREILYWQSKSPYR